MTASYDAIAPLLAKFDCGDALSDGELKSLRNFYSDLLAKMEMLGREFWLATTEIRRRKMKLDDFDRWRREDRS